MKKTFFSLSCATLLFFLGSCNNQVTDNAPIAPDALAANIDSTVKPQDDFFLFANGKWFKNHPIPDSEQQNGLWQLIGDTINAQIHNLCETSAKLTNAETGSAKQKIGDFFYSAMDSVTPNKNGISDFKSDLDKIDNIKDLKGLAEGAYIQSVSGSPFGFGIGQDDKISSKNAIEVRPRRV